MKNINIIKNRLDSVNNYAKFSQNYPLYYNFRESYNYDNLMDSIKLWYNYSINESDNLQKMVNLLEIINEHKNSNEIFKAIDYVNHNIIPYIENTDLLYNLFENSKIDKEYVESIKNVINEMCICDNALNAYNIIKDNNTQFSKFAFNMNNPELLEYTVYRICEDINNLNYDNETKYQLSHILSLYTANNYMEKVPIQEITRDVIDYYLVNYNLLESLDMLKDLSKKNIFVSDYCIRYLNEIESLLASKEKIQNDLSYINHMDEYSSLKKSYNKLLNEYSLGDLKNDIAKRIENIKTVGSGNVNEIKGFIVHKFENVKEDDAANAVNVVLKFIFYIAITLAAITVAGIAVLIGVVGKLIYDTWFSEPAKLNRALKALQSHKENARHAFDTSPFSDKQRIAVYMQSLDREIEKIEHRLTILNGGSVNPQNATPPESITTTITNNAIDVAKHGLGVLGAYKAIEYLQGANKKEEHK